MTAPISPPIDNPSLALSFPPCLLLPIAAAAGPQPGGKASADYSSWGQFNYNQMSGENSAAAAFNHGRGYSDGGAPGPAPPHQGE